MNVETFRREVSKLRKQIGKTELEFYCDQCGQPLKSYKHAELIQEQRESEGEKTRAVLERIFNDLAERQHN